MAAPARHFWNPEETAAFEVANVHQQSDSSKEYIVDAAWESLLEVYFPQRAPVNVARYKVTREAYRGLGEGQHLIRPDALVVKLDNFQVSANPAGGAPIRTMRRRDVLWVECKPPDPDIASAWKDVLKEAVIRLGQSHPDRVVFVVLALGIKWMPFLWDPLPQSTNPGLGRLGPPLQIRYSRGNQTWMMDSRIRMISNASLPGQSHFVIGADGLLTVDTELAYSLDFWTLNPQQVPLNMPALDLLERFFTLVQSTPYHGENEAEWSM